MKSVEGVIILTQEGRFDLVTDRGRVMQFVLAHDASLEPQDLPPLQRDRRRIRVDYTEPGHIIGYVARILRTAGGTSAKAGKSSGGIEK
jgi:hypothetical protein